MFAHHRLRQTQLARDAGEALFLDDLGEDTHAFDTIHVRLPRFITRRDQSYAERRAYCSRFPTITPRHDQQIEG